MELAIGWEWKRVPCSIARHSIAEYREGLMTQCVVHAMLLPTPHD